MKGKTTDHMAETSMEVIRRLMQQHSRCTRVNRDAAGRANTENLR